MNGLRNEAHMLRTLARGTYTLRDLYDRAEAAGLADRPGGRKRIQDGRQQYRRRVRTAVYALQRAGHAQRAPGDEPAWVIEGTVEQPRRALFVWLPADPTHVELVLGEAADILARCDEPIDLVVADPPWALRRDSEHEFKNGYGRTYGRDHDQVVGGYIDVPAEQYAEFTQQWMAAAAAAIRPGGYLAVVTGPQQSARVQCTGEDLGLTYVNSIAVPRRFGQYATRRFVHQHNRVTLLTRGPLDSTRRVFHRPGEMPRGRTGQLYAVDVWDDIPEHRRNNLLRYNNMLHPLLISRVVRSTTNEGDLVADPFVGGGTTPHVCVLTRRRFYGGDLNPDAVRFTMARVLAETVPEARAGALFDPWDLLLQGTRS